MLSTQADYSSIHVDFQTAFTSVGTRFDTVLSLLEQFATTVGSSELITDLLRVKFSSDAEGLIQGSRLN